MYLRYKESNAKFLQCCTCIIIKRHNLQTKTFKSSCACICYKGNEIINILFLFSELFNIFVLNFFIILYMY